MQKYDPYKKTMLFIASLFNVLIMTFIFACCWYHYYAGMMYGGVRFYRKGNYVVIALYALLLFFFSMMYGSLKIGQLRRIEILLSQYLSLLITNLIFYIIISLLAFRFVAVGYLAAAMLCEMVCSSLWDIVVIDVYNRMFQPWKLLLIYGERPASDLVYKVETRRDKYLIYDAIHVDEGMEKIAERVKEFQAVIIGDISAIKRNDILKYCYANKIRAYVIPKISDIILMGTDRVHVFDTPFLLSRGYTLSFEQRLGKRILDLALAVPLLLLALPFMLLTAAAIKVADGGPVFYKQIRCTKYEKEFCIYKFRSMVVDAEKDGVAKLAKENDERITKVGKFIRAVRFDELPQLFNIIKGDMSFVGPRPERPELIREYCRTMPEFPFRNRVKAGLTGYAQVYGKYNTTPYDKLKLDLFYIANWSLWMDVKLILMTVKTIFRRESTEGIEEKRAAVSETMDKTSENIEDIVREIVNTTKEQTDNIGKSRKKSKQ